MIYIVDHVDLDVSNNSVFTLTSVILNSFEIHILLILCILQAWSVPEVLRPLYESPKILAQKMTIAALRHIRQIAHESSGEIPYGAGRQPAVFRTFSQRLSRSVAI
jgi:hypothetical protein